MRYRYGISGDVGTEQMSIGIRNEVLLTPRWSVYAGIRFNKSKGKDFKTVEEFNDETDANFIKTYTNFKDDVPNILDIKFHNYSVQLPVGLTYRYPLPRGFTLLGTVGTDLDIFVRQHLDYEYSFDNIEFDEGRNQVQAKSPVFSNAVLSLGFEKQYQNFVFQLSPYLMKQWRTNVFDNDDLVFGAKLNLMYQLRK